jgi:hypothetical protein
MAISEAYSGTATIGTTEYDLPSNSTSKSSITTDGIYQVFLDLNTLTATESYRLRIYEKTRAVSTQRIVEDVVISGVQSEPVFATPALLLLHGWTVTITKVAGTDRALEWSIRQVA